MLGEDGVSVVGHAPEAAAVTPTVTRSAAQSAILLRALELGPVAMRTLAKTPGGTLHSSLKLRSNLITIGACILVVVGTMTLPGAIPTVAWAVAAVFGIATGDLQSRSIRASAEAFRSARTAVEVRKALMSNAPGRIAVIAQWVLLPVLLGIAWWSGNLIAGVLGGYALFMAVRDLVALRAVVRLTPTAG